MSSLFQSRLIQMIPAVITNVQEHLFQDGGEQRIALSVMVSASKGQPLSLGKLRGSDLDLI